MKIKTVGELKTFLKDIDDNTPISTYYSGMEKSGYLVNEGATFKIEDALIENKTTYDRFDYKYYNYKVYNVWYDRKENKDENNTIKVLTIR